MTMDQRMANAGKAQNRRGQPNSCGHRPRHGHRSRPYTGGTRAGTPAGPRPGHRGHGRVGTPVGRGRDTSAATSRATAGTPRRIKPRHRGHHRDRETRGTAHTCSASPGPPDHTRSFARTARAARTGNTTLRLRIPNEGHPPSFRCGFCV